MYLYVLVGIIGCLLPISERYILQKYDFKNILLLRFILGAAILLVITNDYFNKKKINSIKNIKIKELLFLFLYLVLTFIYVYTILYVFTRDMKKNFSVSQIVPIMSTLTIIIIFFVDLFIFKHKFSKYNYLAILLLILGIILLRFF